MPQACSNCPHKTIGHWCGRLRIEKNNPCFLKKNAKWIQLLIRSHFLADIVWQNHTGPLSKKTTQHRSTLNTAQSSANQFTIVLQIPSTVSSRSGCAAITSPPQPPLDPVHPGIHISRPLGLTATNKERVSLAKRINSELSAWVKHDYSCNVFPLDHFSGRRRQLLQRQQKPSAINTKHMLLMPFFCLFVCFGGFFFFFKLQKVSSEMFCQRTVHSEPIISRSWRRTLMIMMLVPSSLTSGQVASCWRSST